MHVAKTKALISFAVTAKLICVFFSHMQIVGFLMTRLKYKQILYMLHCEKMQNNCFICYRCS